MKTTPIVKFALVLATATSFSLPASANICDWISRQVDRDSAGNVIYNNTYNNHVDSTKQDMAPHTNAPFFMVPGSLPQESWEKLTPAQRDDYAAHMEARKNCTGAMHHHPMMTPETAMHHGYMMHEGHMMGREHPEWDKMTPAQKEEAHKRWEARKAKWEKMTPAQKEAARARWQQEHAGQPPVIHGQMMMQAQPAGTPVVPDESTPTVGDSNKNMDPNMDDMR